MQIQIPENIDLSRPERYVLSIRIHPEQFSFSLHNPADRASFYYPVENRQSFAFHSFKEIYFENEFFSLPYSKIYLINYSQVFTYVPSLIFESKDKEAYVDFLFPGNTGKTLFHSLTAQGITIVHTLQDEIYEFFQRSFIEAKIIHHTAPLIAYFQKNRLRGQQNRMLINLQNTEMDVFCFSSESILLGNHFHCNSPADVVYYILYIWKQLKFDQLNDFIHIAGESEIRKTLIENLSIYLQRIVPETDWETIDGRHIPFEMNCLSLCEL
jgi:hypothetical protein